MAEIRLEKITKKFDQQIALDQLSFQIEDGEFLVLLGQTGAGKTTTLRCIAGLTKPNHGEIFFDGKPMIEISPADRDVAFVFQEHILYPHMTVRENMSFPLKPRGYSISKIDQRVSEIAEMLHITDLLDRKPTQLSGGETQRVGLGRAMVRRPKVFLMDEPISALDAKLRAEMRSEIKWRQRQMGVTTLYVTHDYIEALSMADRIVILDHGKTVQIGTPNEIYNTPKNLFVANFIGNPTMNQIPCVTIRQNKSNILIKLIGELKIDLDEKISKKLIEQPKNDLILGVHPEDVRIDQNGSTDGLSAEIYGIEPLGVETIVDLNFGKDDFGRSFIAKARTSPDFRGLIGEVVEVNFDQDRLHFFDRETGEAIM